MANGALFVGWNYPKAGMERQALELFQTSLQFYTNLQKDGRIESFEPVLLAVHGGDLNGFVLVRGDEDKLASLRRDPDFKKIMAEGAYCVDGFGVIDGVINNGVADFLKDWSQLIRS